MIYKSDLLIVGSGIAGLCLSLRVAKSKKVILVTKENLHMSNTKYAQGGISAVISPNDTIESHIHDTMQTGNGLSKEDAVRMLAEGGKEAIEELLTYGTPFTRSLDSKAWNQLDLGREGGHSHHRIVHAKDRTGQAIEDALVEQVLSQENITILEWHTLIELLTPHHTLKRDSCPNCCYGAIFYDRGQKEIATILAAQTVLATGGCGEIYEHTTNPSIATGDGIAAAWRAGAAIANMEFIQFHPTTLYHSKADSFLISEALRGHGAILKDAEEKEFMHKYHPMGSLAPRDIVARAIDREMKKSGEPCVYLDIRHADPEEVQDRFPKIYANCLKFGIDITKDLIPVVPASHYCCGGIEVDLVGKTNLENLFAVGEVSCTGVHGANRLASNSLLEAVIFAKSCAETVLATQAPSIISEDEIIPWDDKNTKNAEEWVLISHNKKEIQRIMWDYVGIVRSDERLTRAMKRITLIQDEVEHYYKKTKICTSILELRNMATVAELIIESALQRKESRGLHFNKEYPDKNPQFKRDTILKKEC